MLLNQHISTIPLLRHLIVNQWVVKSIHVSRGLPDRWVHKDGRVDTYHIIIEQGHGIPPVPLEIVFEFYTILTIVVYCP